MLWVKPSDPNKLKLLIAFSGAYLLSITALHLLPEVFIGDDRGRILERSSWSVFLSK